MRFYPIEAPCFLEKRFAWTSLHSLLTKLFLCYRDMFHAWRPRPHSHPWCSYPFLLIFNKRSQVRDLALTNGINASNYHHPHFFISLKPFHKQSHIDRICIQGHSRHRTLEDDVNVLNSRMYFVMFDPCFHNAHLIFYFERIYLFCVFARDWRIFSIRSFRL